MKFFKIFLVMSMFSILTLGAVEQTLVKPLRKNGFVTKKPFLKIFNELRQSSVKFVSAEGEVIYGTVLTESGLVLTKNSEAEAVTDLEVITSAGETVNPVLLAVDESRDLALYRIRAKNLVPVKWVDQKDVRTGQWCISPLLSDFEGKIGVIAVAPRSLPKQALLSGKNAMMSGKISLRPDNYPLVYQHDLPLWKHEVGGPLANSSGRVFALNISRANRCEYYSLPTSEISESLKSMKLSKDVAKEVSEIEFPEQFLFSDSTVHALNKEHIEIQRKFTEVYKTVKKYVVCIKISDSGFGSGVLISDDGYVLTAAHVSGKPGSELGVILSDGKTYIAKSLGFYKKTDVSLVKILNPPGKLSHAEMGQVKKVKTADWSFVLSHPNGYRKDRGSVLRCGRVLKSSQNSFIRTDCNLIGGDSGGPLFNLKGEVIGINSQVQNHYERNFHGPVSAYQANWDEFTKAQEIPESFIKPLMMQSKFFIGFRGRTLENGALVSGVFPESPAAKAQLQAGDVILFANNKKLGQEYSLRSFFLELKKSEVIFIISRNDVNKIITIKSEVLNF